MAINLYSKASVDSLLAGKLSVSTLTNGAASGIDSTVPTSGKVLSFDGTNLKWVTASGGGTWGSITGTLSAQTDLNTALNARVSTAGDTMDNNALLEFNDTTSNSTLGINGNGVVTTLAPSPGEYSQLTYNGLLLTDGINTMTMGPTGLTFPDATVQTTAFTGVAPIGNQISIYSGYLYNETTASYVTALTLSGNATVQAKNLKMELGAGGSLTFADGTSMTSAAHSIPGGGSANQVLSKINSADYNVQWSTLSYLVPANNLSDLVSASTARTNLGLGTAATFASTAFSQTANNLSDLASASTARTNLGLGTIATFNDAASDGTTYGRKNGAWSAITSGGGVDVQTFGSSTSSGSFTWTKPAGAKVVDVFLFGAGAGGGAGRRDATTGGRSGGGGGGGGAIFYGRISAAYLGATETVVVGAGGSGAPSQTTNSVNGATGVAGGNTTISFFKANGGNAGSGGGVSNGGSGGATTSLIFISTTAPNSGGGGTTTTGTTAGATSTGTFMVPLGGGGGAGALANITTAAAGGAGGAMVSGQAGINSNIAGGSAGTTAGVAATAGTSQTTNNFQGGTGGGGGYYITGVAGGAGGAGGWPGGGGGGGGASDNGNASGKGGDGANGFAVIITYF